MKKKQLDNVHEIVCQLCATLRDDTVSLTRLSDLLDCVIELARTGHTLEAIAINREVMSFLAEGHSRSVHQARQKAWVDSVKAQSGSRIGIVGDEQAWWKAGDASRFAATIEQMQAAADAAMKDNIGWFVCTGCGKKTATADGKKPLAWVFNAEVDGEVYKALCAPCFGTGILKQYNCRDCDSTTESRVHPAPGWTDVGDGEFICFACAEEEAKP